jgi:hypothetical protein
MKAKRYYPADMYLTKNCKKNKRNVTEIRYYPKIVGSTVGVYFNTSNPNKMYAEWLFGDAPDIIRNFIQSQLETP